MVINTNDDRIRVELHGHEQLWALRAKVDVPLEDIKSVRFENLFQDWRKWEVRVPGTAIPKVLFAGSYWTEQGWDFLYIKKPHGVFKPFAENVLVIETSQSRFARVIVSTTPEEAKNVINWWNRNKFKK